MKKLILIAILFCGCAAPIAIKNDEMSLVPEQTPDLVEVNLSIYDITTGYIMPDSIRTCGCTHYEVFFDVGQGDVAWGAVSVLSLAIYDRMPLPTPTYNAIYFDVEKMFYWLWDGGYFVEGIIVKCYRKIKTSRALQ